MKIQMLRGQIHARGDLIRGAVYAVGEHPDSDTAKRLLSLGHAKAMPEDTKAAPAPKSDKAAKAEKA